MTMPVPMPVPMSVPMSVPGLFLAHGIHDAPEKPPQHLDKSACGAGANAPHLPL
ncbi:hypothetical protein ACQPZZ_28680 [Microbispora sp. CA-135349]|uniref:hypothetical protein n=1 Tax=Microbispora sp. CA-135349 TaxID=3239953 RepID=UPI003D90726D